MKTILQVQNLRFAYPKGRDLFQNVCMDVNKGEIFSILGKNGAGKTTFLNCIMGLLAPLEGQILVNGQNLKQCSSQDLAKQIAYVSQAHNLAYDYPVREFVVMGRAPYISVFKRPKKSDYQLVDEVMERLNITHLRNKIYTQMSGGERQLVSIARALVQEPDLLILDEPTNHLDYGNQLRMLELIQNLAKTGIAIMMTCHMPDYVLMLNEKVGILQEDGSFISGDTKSIVTQEALERLYKTKIPMLYVQEAGRQVCIPVKP